MAGNLIIVAIPDESDRVWKVSSEKVPHLTLLFLGEDTDQVSNLEQIVLFAEHAANTTLRRFYLPVDRRGKLGEAEADVLFFRKDRYDFKAIRDFRATLLQDPNIKKAYDAASQFETPEYVGASGQPWIPHLTLGYPESPAKPESNDQLDRIYSVEFTKIAVWTGDFEGPEFLLKDYWEDFDMGDIPMNVAMSEIAHYGTKGMRWGVRKEETARGGHIRISRQSGRAAISGSGQTAVIGAALVLWPLAPAIFLASPRLRSEWKAAGDHNKLARKDDKWKREVEKSKKRAEVHNQAASEINSKLKAFNQDKRWKNPDGTDIDFKENPTKHKEYDRTVENEVLNPAYARAALKIHGANSPGGRYTLSIQNDKTAVLKIDDHLRQETRRTTVRHADGEDGDVFTVRFEITRNANGHILGFAPEDHDDIQHIAELGAEFLAHYGVKGMRWGVRKEEVSSGARAVGRAAKSSGGAIGKAAGAVGRFAGDVSFENRAEDGRARETVINASQSAFRGTDLPALKARHGDYAKLRNRVKKPFSAEAKAYRRDAQETYIKRLETTANSMTNLSGNRQYTIRERGIELPAQGGNLPQSKYYWEVSTREVHHAVTDPFTRLEVIFDDEGFIVDLKPVALEDSMAQTTNLGEAFLEHYGVRGMHWGIRRARATPTAVHPSAQSVVPRGSLRKTQIKTEGGENHPAHEDAIKVAQAQAKLKKSGTAALSNKELQELQTRLNLERNVSTLVRDSSRVGKGRKFVRDLTGFNQEVNTTVGTGLNTAQLARRTRRQFA